MGTGQSGPGLGVTYRIVLRPAAIRALRGIHPGDRDRIRGALALLSLDPRPPGAKALRGRDALRVRVGAYRIIYSVNDQELIVLVVAVGHRRDVYRP